MHSSVAQSCMYACVRVCINFSTCSQLVCFLGMWLFVHVRTYNILDICRVLIYARTYVCMYVRMCARVGMYVCTCVCVHVWVCMYVRAYVCTCGYVCMCSVYVCTFAQAGQLSYEEAIIARQSHFQETREKVKALKEESEQVMNRYFAEREEQKREMRQLVETIAEGRENVKEARDKLQRMKQEMGALCTHPGV